VDTAISKSDHGGAVAAVCRDDGEGFIGVSAITVDNFSHPAMLEALACHEALALAQYLNLHKICVATDCLEVANNLHGPIQENTV
jgi:hypothetical protein